MIGKGKLFIAMLAMASMQAAAQGQMELTATEVAKQMAPGWNLGNTLEAGDSKNNFTNKGGLGAETAWQSTKTTQQIINYVRQQGFRSIRIPCAWVMGHISNASDYTIDAAWMARVKEIVDYSLQSGLYVVINQHWDGGWLENNISKTADMEKNKQILARIWEQIAATFRDYDERLLFAGLNEPNVDDQDGKNATQGQNQTNNLLAYEQTFIDVVRQSGGNNANRVLIIQGPGTDIDKTNKYMKTMPTDTAKDRLMVEVHYYAPWQWWGMEKDESWGKMFFYWGAENHVSGSKHNATWGEESFVETQLEKMKTQFQDKGIPVYIGEFGANWRKITGAGESQEKHNASIQYHYRVVVEKALKKGMVPVIWDTNYTGYPSMTIINRKNLSIHNQYMMNGVSEAMKAAGVPVASVHDVSAPETDNANALVYDLQGRLLTEVPERGLYIKGGRKIMK